jgi:hypothetical protein
MATKKKAVPPIPAPTYTPTPEEIRAKTVSFLDSEISRHRNGMAAVANRLRQLADGLEMQVVKADARTTTSCARELAGLAVEVEHRASSIHAIADLKGLVTE